MADGAFIKFLVARDPDGKFPVRMSAKTSIEPDWKVSDHVLPARDIVDALSAIGEFIESAQTAPFAETITIEIEGENRSFKDH